MGSCKYIFISFFASLVILSQAWLSITVFRHYDVCNQDSFDKYDNYTSNYEACTSTLNTDPWLQLGCECRQSYGPTSIRIFNDGTVAAASFLFIAILVIEGIRLCVTIPLIFSQEEAWEGFAGPMTDWTISSPWGFFALVLNPALRDFIDRKESQNQTIMNHGNFGMIFLDAAALGTFLLYIHHVPQADNVLFWSMMIGTTFNQLRYGCSIYLINKLEFNKKNLKLTVLEGLVTENPPPHYTSASPFQN